MVIRGQNVSCAPLPYVFFGGSLGSVTGCTTTAINVTTPAFSLAGPVDVTGQHPAGDASRASGFTYTATLTVTTTGTGSFTTNPAALAGCGAGCGVYGSTPVRITVTQGTPGNTVDWSGDCGSCGTDTTTYFCDVIMNANKTCTVNFD